MVFSSTIFLFIFLPLLISAYFLIKSQYRNELLLVASIIFYAWGEPRYLLLLAASTAVNFFLGLQIDKVGSRRFKRFCLIVAIAYNIGILLFFKYLIFGVSIVDDALGTSIMNHHQWIHKIILPLGISFFTFQIMSYVIDVYLGKVASQKSFIKLALYISFFPQLIAGPIVRYADIAAQIDNREFTTQRLYKGAKRFMVGFLKKVILANYMGAMSFMALSHPDLTGAIIWFVLICYLFHFYFDFSAYSDMAIGLGCMFGFDFKENFNYPLTSRSFTEFWRRWHISLGTWFRDYLYFPLGGSRKGPVRNLINVFIVFFLIGLWHGASWSFIIFGLYQAVFLCIEGTRPFKRIYEKMPSLIQRVVFLLVLLTGVVFFMTDNLTVAMGYIKKMFSPTTFSVEPLLYYIDREFVFMLICCWIASTPLAANWAKKHIDSNGQARYTHVADSLLMITFFIGILYLAGGSFNPFIYFRF